MAISSMVVMELHIFYERGRTRAGLNKKGAANFNQSILLMTSVYILTTYPGSRACHVGREALYYVKKKFIERREML